MTQNRQIMLAEVEQRYKDRQNADGNNFETVTKNPVANTAIPEGKFKF